MDLLPFKRSLIEIIRQSQTPITIEFKDGRTVTGLLVDYDEHRAVLRTRPWNTRQRYRNLRIDDRVLLFTTDFMPN